MKGKRKPNDHKEKRGKQAFKKNIFERLNNYPHFKEDFGHLEGDSIVGVHYKNVVITLVKRLSKAIITLKPNVRKAQDIEVAVNNWLRFIPKKSLQNNHF